MSRRDTIMIAAFLNAGLLVVLFTTALKTEPSARENAGVEPPMLALQSFPDMGMPKEPVIRPSGDEVDQVLRDLAQPPPVRQASSPKVLAAPVSVVDEINALAFAAQDAPALKEPVIQSKASTTAQKATTIDVVVKKGDVLEKIARTHQTTTEQIMKQNHLTSTQLQIGQVLKVTPHTASAKKEASAVIAQNAPASAKYYTVKNGDNPWTIAVKNQMKVDELLKLNNLDDEKARRLKPGDQLRIR